MARGIVLFGKDNDLSYEEYRLNTQFCVTRPDLLWSRCVTVRGATIKIHDIMVRNSHAARPFCHVIWRRVRHAMLQRAN